MLPQLALLVGAVVLQAATITHGTATDISGDADIVTTGTLVGAFTLGDSSVLSPTVNDVAFTGLDISSGSSTSGDFSLSLDFRILGTRREHQRWLERSLQHPLSFLPGHVVFSRPASAAYDGDDRRYTLRTNPHSDAPGALGRFVTDSFIADGSTQTIVLSAPPHGGTAEINAFQLPPRRR